MRMHRGARPVDRPLEVLYSFGPPANDANPYVHLLLESVSSGATVHYFSWKFAVFGSYDVFHVHWPETLVRRPTLKGRLVCRALLLLLLGRLALSGIPIIRTEHNLRPHEAGNRTETALLNLLDKRADVWVVMNEVGAERPVRNATYIPHGHYRDWYQLESTSERKRGSLLNFGLIRPYKGVEDLVAAFKGLPSQARLHLNILGKPQSVESGKDLSDRIGDAPSITADLRHIPDPDLTSAITQASLVVLPYRAMHNSGALLLALSLDTPVLVPKNAMTDALAVEVGQEWVQRFEGPLTPDMLVAAAGAAEGITGRPDLSQREWSEIGDKHLYTYRLAAGLPTQR